MSSRIDDLQKVKNINKSIWKDHPPQYLSKYGYEEDLPIGSGDLEFVLYYFKAHQDELIFEPGSGVFGFGISMTVYTLIYPIYPGLPFEKDELITLTSKQITESGWKSHPYELFSKFIYTDRNKELRKTFGFKEELKDLAFYDY